jgi:hypothetical protein
MPIPLREPLDIDRFSDPLEETVQNRSEWDTRTGVSRDQREHQKRKHAGSVVLAVVIGDSVGRSGDARTMPAARRGFAASP